jgi:hypothetical protein
MEGHYIATEKVKARRIVDWTANVRRVFEILERADALNGL